MKRIKSIKSILLMLSMVFMFSCMDMYNDIADEYGAEYNYFLAVTQAVVSGKTQIYSLETSGFISQSLGSLNNPSTLYPTSIAAHPSGKYLFIPIFDGTGYIWVYKIDENGILSHVQNFALVGIISLAIHPSGNYLYCANGGTDYFAECHIEENGTLTSIGTGQTTPSGQNKIAISPSGNYLYAGGTSSSSKIYIFPINTKGALSTPSATNAIGGGPSIISIKVSNNGSVYCTTSSTGIYLYDKDTNNLVSQDNCDANGFIAFHPSGGFIYVSSGTKIYVYKINNDNSLTYAGLFIAPGSINEILVHPNGKVLYLSGNNYVYSYSLNNDGTIRSQIQSISSSSADGLALIRQKK